MVKFEPVSLPIKKGRLETSGIDAKRGLGSGPRSSDLLKSL